MKTKLLVLLTLAWGSSFFNALAGDEMDEPGTNLQSLTLTIRCSNSVFRLGDEIPIEFVISNIGTTHFPYADRTSDRSGRMPEFAITVQTSEGKTLPDARANRPAGISGGLYGVESIGPKEFFSRTIPLNLWAIPPSPGQYMVTGTYLGGDGYGAIQPPSGIHSEPIRITILPRTESEMDAYICALTNEISAAKSAGRDWQPSVEKLTYTCSPKIVPFMLNEMYESRYNFWEAEALVVYVPHSDAVRKQIVAAAVHRGLAGGMDYVLNQYHGTAEEWRRAITRSLVKDNQGCWATGALSAQNYPDDAFMPRLIDIALNGTNDVSRFPAIYALSCNRTDASVEALRALLNSTNAEISSTAQGAIHQAYFRGGESKGRPLRPDDFDKKFQQRLNAGRGGN